MLPAGDNARWHIVTVATALHIGLSDQAGWMQGTAGQHGIRRNPCTTAFGSINWQDWQRLFKLGWTTRQAGCGHSVTLHRQAFSWTRNIFCGRTACLSSRRGICSSLSDQAEWMWGTAWQHGIKPSTCIKFLAQCACKLYASPAGRAQESGRCRLCDIFQSQHERCAHASPMLVCCAHFAA